MSSGSVALSSTQDNDLFKLLFILVILFLNFFGGKVSIHLQLDNSVNLLLIECKMFHDLSLLCSISISYGFVSNDRIVLGPVLDSHVCHEDSALNCSIFNIWSSTS